MLQEAGPGSQSQLGGKEVKCCLFLIQTGGLRHEGLGQMGDKQAWGSLEPCWDWARAQCT